MRPVHADGMSRAAREIQRHAAGERAAVIDDDGDGLPIAGIGHRHPRSEWQGAVRSGMATGIERLAAGGAATGGIPGRDHLSACASAFRPHTGKKPRKTAARELADRRDVWAGRFRGHCSHIAESGEHQEREDEDG